MLLDGAPWSFFAPGLKIEADVGNRLGLPFCSPALDRHSFVLVVAFGRCKFRLDPLSVGSILQATIGGLVTQFNVSLLSNRTFRFFVSSKQVGFYIADLRSFSCDAFYLEFIFGAMEALTGGRNSPFSRRRSSSLGNLLSRTRCSPLNPPASLFFAVWAILLLSLLQPSAPMLPQACIIFLRML